MSSLLLSTLLAAFSAHACSPALALVQDEGAPQEAGEEGGWTPPPPPPVVPSPLLVQPRFAPFVLPDTVRIVATEDGLERQARLLQDTLEKRLGRRIPLGERPAHSGDILLTLGYLTEPVAENPEAFWIEVFDDHAAISAANATGIARAIARLAQLFQFDEEHGVWALPPTRIEDAPSFPWRGLMLDVARFPHPVESVREAIDLAFLFSLNVVHLHLSDDQAFTFPASCLEPRTDPGGGGPDRGYSLEDLSFLVQYAADRGIALVPEIDMPAHSSVLVRSRPDLFGRFDPETGEHVSTGAVNMASPRAIEALKELVDEVSAVFHTSPYFHLGGDEFYAPALLDLPEFQALGAEKGLPSKLEDGALNAHLNQFLRAMSEHVLKGGLQPIVWEGFRPMGAPEKTLDPRTWVMSWNQHAFPPEALIEAGYTVLNCGWEPLYIVPAQGWASRPADAFDWTPMNFRQRFGGRAVELGAEARASIKGAQVCVWEQRPEAIVPAVLRLAPEFSERMWGSHATPDTHAEFDALALSVVELVRSMLRPVELSWTSDLGFDTVLFEERTEVRFETNAHAAPGEVRYVTGPTFGEEPTVTSTLASEKPLVLEESTVVAAALFSADGRRIGGVTQVRFEKGTPVLEFDAYRLPQGGDFAPGDFDELASLGGPGQSNWIGDGKLMRPTPARIAAIQREQFARVRPGAHVDLRPIAWTEFGPEGARVDAARPRLWGRHAIVARGQVTIPTPGRWTLEFQSRGGVGRLTLGSATATCGPDDQPVRRAAELAAGTYSLCIEHAVLDVHEDLQVWLTPEGASERWPLTRLLRASSAPVAPRDLADLASFRD